MDILHRVPDSVSAGLPVDETQVAIVDDSRRMLEKLPAMAAGIVKHVRTVKDLLTAATDL
jgi:hypothetical protein